MKRLLILTSLLEGATGLALMAKPSSVVTILLGSPLTDPISIIIARLAGAALVSLSITCWFSQKNISVFGLITALLFYNVASVFLLGYAGLYESMNGIGLWPAVAVHIAMALWCAKLLYRIKN